MALSIEYRPGVSYCYENVSMKEKHKLKQYIFTLGPWALYKIKAVHFAWTVRPFVTFELAESWWKPVLFKHKFYSRIPLFKLLCL